MSRRGPWITFLRWCPGALGIFLRQKFFPRLFLECGPGVVFGRFLNLVKPESIRIGAHCIISDRVTLAAMGDTGTIDIGSSVFLGFTTTLTSLEGSLRIGSGASLGSFCQVHARTGVHIQEKCLLAAYTEIGARPGGVGNEPRQDAPVILGSGCWVGVRTEIENGVTIGPDCIIGAHARVRADIPPLAVAVGRPAKVVRVREREILHGI